MKIKFHHPPPYIFLALLLGFGLSIFNISQVLYCDQRLGCINEYWGQFWLTSYSDGYSRRGFLGHIVRATIGVEIPYLYINYLSFSLALFVLIFTLVFYFRRHIHSPAWVILFAMLMSGPSSTLLFEVLGDPLQTCFVLLVPFLFIQKYKFLSLAYGFIAAILMILTHEAAIFIFIPALYLIYRLANRQTISIIAIFVFILVISAFYGIALSDQVITGHTMSIVAKDGTLFSLYQTSLPSFSSLLKEEFEVYFGSLRGIIYFASKIFRVIYWPFLFLFLAFIFLRDKKSVKIFIFLLLVSSPLYIIAHDWGRFGIYTMLLALMVSNSFGGDDTGLRFLDKQFEWVSEKVDIQFSAIAIFPLLFISYDSYRIHGISLANTIYIFVATAILYIIHKIEQNSKNNQQSL